MKYKFLEHTADIKFIMHGKNPKAIFENCALALSEFLSNGNEIKNISEKKFKIAGRDYEELLYNFIDEIIYFFDAENFIPLNAQIKLEEVKGKKILRAILFGDKTKDYENLKGLKSATYSEMYVENKGDKWEAQAVVDV